MFSGGSRGGRRTVWRFQKKKRKKSRLLASLLEILSVHPKSTGKEDTLGGDGLAQKPRNRGVSTYHRIRITLLTCLRLGLGLHFEENFLLPLHYTDTFFICLTMLYRQPKKELAGNRYNCSTANQRYLGI